MGRTIRESQQHAGRARGDELMEEIEKKKRIENKTNAVLVHHSHTLVPSSLPV